MSKLFTHLSSEQQVAMEMIDFQHDSYAMSVEVLFSEIIDDFRNNAPTARNLNKHPALRKIEEITFKRTGIKLNIVTTSHVAAVLPFYPNEYSVFLDESLRGKIYSGSYGWMNPQGEKLIKSALEKKGTVDTKTCKVTGIFSEYTNPIYINIKVLTQLKLNAAEITAVFLHELGHAFSSFEYSNRLNRTNQVLADLLQKTTNKKEMSKDYLFKELKILNPKTTNEELDKIFSGDNIILGTTTFNFMKEMIESQLPSDYYNANSFETLADNFAARWGYGKELVTSLEKFQDKSIFNPEQSRFGQAIASVSTVILIIGCCYFFLQLVGASIVLTLGAVAAATASAALLAFYSILVTCLVGLIVGVYILSHSSTFVPMTYDDLKYRYQRIRNQLIEMLKDTDLPKKQTTEVIDQVKVLDEIVAKTNNYKNLVTIILDFFTPGDKEVKDDMKMQRLLEELSANDLYLKAAQLRTGHA